MPVTSLQDRLWIFVVYLYDSKCCGPEGLQEVLSTPTHANEQAVEPG